jgi:hypothetical protein
MHGAVPAERPAGRDLHTLTIRQGASVRQGGNNVHRKIERIQGRGPSAGRGLSLALSACTFPSRLRPEAEAPTASPADDALSGANSDAHLS